MITSSPSFQFTGVATWCFAVSCSESITRNTSSKFRPVDAGYSIFSLIFCLVQPQTLSARWACCPQMDGSLNKDWPHFCPDLRSMGNWAPRPVFPQYRQPRPCDLQLDQLTSQAPSRHAFQTLALTLLCSQVLWCKQAWNFFWMWEQHSPAAINIVVEVDTTFGCFCFEIWGFVAN